MGPRARGGVVAAVAVAAFVVLLVAIGAPMGLFTGKPPADLGLAGGKLRGGDWRPNWVSSQAPASDATHHVAPFDTAGNPAATWKALERTIAHELRAKLVTRLPGYLHVEFASAAMGFVDDGEFALDAAAGVIHVRSGARLGIRDFDVNRERIERLRTALAPARP
jgi:uncharacterized protein (DUF1499 family)